MMLLLRAPQQFTVILSRGCLIFFAYIKKGFIAKSIFYKGATLILANLATCIVNISTDNTIYV